MSRAYLFNHPGPEAKCVRGTCKWNEGDHEGDHHQRKFLLMPGVLAERVAEAGYRAGDYAALVGFWGEWEPESKCGDFRASISPGYPARWHRPTRDCVPGPASLNTDPWVFNSPMRYSVCHQGARNANALRTLAAGDVLLFGSCKACNCDGPHTYDSYRWDFVLDTVFVVERGHPYSTSPLVVPQSANVSPDYRKFVLDRLARYGPTKAVIYNGAGLARQPQVAPFSWVPCKVGDEKTESVRFARPKISDVFGIGFPNQQTPLREIPQPGEAVWRAVVERCEALDLSLGVRLDL